MLEVCELIKPNGYSITKHVIGLLLVFAVSFLSIFSTFFLSQSTAKHHTTTRILNHTKFFGIGVIAGTAWCHLLPDAFGHFSSPCLQGWPNYSAFAGLFGLFGAFLVHAVELSSQHSHDPTYSLGHSDISSLTLEAGILVHSVIIGLALGMKDDIGFPTLLAAICFHQFFEGMALGSLISSLNISKKSKYLASALYPITTPVGIAVGIIVKDSFNLNSPVLIGVQGINSFNLGILGATSAGILIYSTYCELLGSQINHNAKFRAYPLKSKATLMSMMYLGASAMAIVAIWT